MFTWAVNVKITTKPVGVGAHDDPKKQQILVLYLLLKILNLSHFIIKNHFARGVVGAAPCRDFIKGIVYPQP